MSKSYYWKIRGSHSTRQSPAWFAGFSGVGEPIWKGDQTRAVYFLRKKDAEACVEGVPSMNGEPHRVAAYEITGDVLG